MYGWKKYEILFRRLIIKAELESNMGEHRHGNMREMVGESKLMGQKGGRGRNNGILSELNCDVKECDGSVNSNKSPVFVLLYFGLLNSRYRSKLELTMIKTCLCLGICANSSLHSLFPNIAHLVVVLVSHNCFVTF